MPAWKVLLIGLLACIFIGRATASVVVPFNYDGNQRWLWLGGLLSATLFMGVLLALFLRHAGGAMDAKPRGARR
jgi:hypothetical protein